MTSKEIQELFNNMTMDEQHKARQILEAFFSMIPSDITAELYREYMEKDNEGFYSIMSSTENIFYNGVFYSSELEGYTIDELDMDKKNYVRVGEYGNGGIISTDIKKYLPLYDTADYFIDCMKQGVIYD